MEIIKDFEQWKNPQRVKVSCASLASIKIDGKYLLVQNKGLKKKGRVVWGPFGGTLKYEPSAKEFLESLDIEWVKEEKDLSFFLPASLLPDFEKWFYSQGGRENSVLRELREEMIDEERLLDYFQEGDLKEEFAGSVKDLRESPSTKIPTHYYFEIFKIRLSDELENLLRTLSSEDRTIKTFTASEILAQGDSMGSHSQFIII